MLLTAIRWCLMILMWLLALGFAIMTGAFGYGMIRNSVGMWKERHVRNPEWKEYEPIAVIVFGGVTLLLVIICWILVLIALNMGRDLL